MVLLLLVLMRLLLLVLMLTLLEVFWLLLLMVPLMLTLQVLRCVLVVLVLLTLPLVFPGNPCNRVKLMHWMLLYCLHVGRLWVGGSYSCLCLVMVPQ